MSARRCARKRNDIAKSELVRRWRGDDAGGVRSDGAAWPIISRGGVGGHGWARKERNRMRVNAHAHLMRAVKLHNK